MVSQVDAVSQVVSQVVSQAKCFRLQGMPRCPRFFSYTHVREVNGHSVLRAFKTRLGHWDTWDTAWQGGCSRRLPGKVGISGQ